uniref:Retrovirus-related Pol polyprotein from transposon TNT 1-94 n=1 Tax=Cajanus cajan TaxID=3821 RepID=A0A151TRS0_CAJCA|nr:hypothetical protein KK1_008965 [Cajanus cajan]
MVGCNHAHQIWKYLHTYFESQTCAKVYQLKTQLKGIRKIDSLNNYLLSIKKIEDILASVGSPIDPSEHIPSFLMGFQMNTTLLLPPLFHAPTPISLLRLKLS